MADNLTKTQRSKCMSNIKSKWTIQERKVHNCLKGNKIMHKMHPKIEGNPDMILTNSNTAVFLQGCFWHNCPACYVAPKSNTKYWLPKIKRNVERDKLNAKVLKSQGYNVITIWEHEIKKDLNSAINKMIQND